MRPKKAAFVHSDEIEKYHYPPECPFKTERAGRTREILQSMGYYTGGGRIEVPPQSAQEEDLRLFHTKEYLRVLKDATRGELNPEALFMGLGTDETPIFRDMFSYAALAAGGSITGAWLLLDGRADIAFNPSGGFHHADAEHAGGFCYINDIVLACKVLSAAGRRVFCVDIDAHHGNGTQAAFYHSAEVFTLSLHESGKTLYPWGGSVQEIGEGSGHGYNVNIPLPAGTDDDTYLAAFREVVPPLIRAFAPDVIVLEIGMDILSVDPLTHLKMTNNVVADIIPLITQFQKPILATGGGGYEPESAARGWALAWCVLAGIDFETDMYIGMGGTFLGSSEWEAGLRDMRAYTRGADRDAVVTQTASAVENVKKRVFPIHGID